MFTLSYFHDTHALPARSLLPPLALRFSTMVIMLGMDDVAACEGWTADIAGALDSAAASAP